MTLYLRPATLQQALSELGRPGMRALGGGTDLYPASPEQALAMPVVDLSGIPDLQGISHTGQGIRIGASTTWSQIIAADLPPGFSALQQAARQVGGWQIQNAGTLGGNLCNASPAADGVPPLLVLGAEVDLAGPQGRRSLPLGEFLIGPRRTALQPAEILVAVTVPATGLHGRSRFLKLGARVHLVISITMVAVRVVVEGGRIADCALAVGSCGPVAVRLAQAEAALIGVPLVQAAAMVDAAMVAAALAPIDDIRATAAYRARAAATLVSRALSDLAGTAP
jgi:CO/xanthine dehydrogenase FAD-binding subunit